MARYTNRSLIALLDVTRERPINCLEVRGEELPVMWKIVNVHEDLTGFHLVIERVG